MTTTRRGWVIWNSSSQIGRAVLLAVFDLHVVALDQVGAIDDERIHAQAFHALEHRRARAAVEGHALGDFQVAGLVLEKEDVGQRMPGARRWAGTPRAGTSGNGRRDG